MGIFPTAGRGGGCPSVLPAAYWGGQSKKQRIKWQALGQVVTLRGQTPATGCGRVSDSVFQEKFIIFSLKLKEGFVSILYPWKKRQGQTKQASLQNPEIWLSCDEQTSSQFSIPNPLVASKTSTKCFLKKQTQLYYYHINQSMNIVFLKCFVPSVGNFKVRQKLSVPVLMSGIQQEQKQTALSPAGG